MEKGDHSAVIFGTHFPNRLFVGCLPPKATAEHLGKFFGTFGKVVEAKVVLDDQKRSKRFGFVSFSKAEEAEHVLKQGSIYLMGKKINVGPAVKKESKDTLPQVPVRIVTTTPVEQSMSASPTAKPRYTYTFPSTTSCSSSCNSSPLPSPPLTPPRIYSPPTVSMPSVVYPSNSMMFPSYQNYVRQNGVQPQNLIYMPVNPLNQNQQTSFVPQPHQFIFIPSY